MVQLQQGFAIDEMGQFAHHQFCAAHVRFGSKADIAIGRTALKGRASRGRSLFFHLD
jgi:hypothetical protein